MKKQFLAALLIVTFHFTNAQTSARITGKLHDSKGAPISLVNVALIRLVDTSLITGVTSDANGNFSLPVPVAGNYFLRYSSIGFAEERSPEFVITTNPLPKDFGVVVLKQEAKNLSEVTVQSLRPTIVQKADRMIVSVEGTALAAGNTAYDVLAKAPGVFVDHEGNIQLNGRAGVTIMIDGKLTYLSANDLKTMLQSMPAENLKNIEIIVNPSAKYDAEGASGILNINLKKNDRRGINGSIYSGYNFNGKQQGYSVGTNINYKSGRWNTFITLDMSRRVGGREATFTRIFRSPGKTTFFDQVASGNFVVQGPPFARLGADYSINDKNSVGVMLYYGTNLAHQDFLTETYIGPTSLHPTIFIDADNYQKNRYTNYTANLHFQSKLDTLGSLFTADADFVKITNRGDANLFNYFDSLENNSPVITERLYSNSPNGFDIYSGKVDYTKMFKSGNKIEAGLKASHVVSDNDARFYFNNSGLVLDPLRTNHFLYEENIYAAYSNFSRSFGKIFEVQGGLRMEHTSSIGKQLTTGQVTQRDYTNLFPSLFILGKFSTNYQATFNYSRRLNRPNYGYLNPFRNYRDPYTWYEGNPYLRPSYAHVLTLTQTIKKNYILTLTYQKTTDGLSELPRLDVDNATTIYYTGNVNDGENYSISAVAPVRITKKWDVNNTALLSYSKFELTQDGLKLTNDQLYYFFQSNHTILLPQNFRFELNAFYRGPAASGLYQIEPWLRVDLGVKKSFLKKKMELAVNVPDIFKTQRLKFNTNIAGNINNFDQYFRNRSLNVTLRYNFSKGLKTETRKNNSLEEVNRTGG